MCGCCPKGHQTYRVVSTQGHDGKLQAGKQQAQIILGMFTLVWILNIPCPSFPASHRSSCLTTTPRSSFASASTLDPVSGVNAFWV